MVPILLVIIDAFPHLYNKPSGNTPIPFCFACGVVNSGVDPACQGGKRYWGMTRICWNCSQYWSTNGIRRGGANTTSVHISWVQMLATLEYKLGRVGTMIDAMSIYSNLPDWIR